MTTSLQTNIASLEANIESTERMLAKSKALLATIKAQIAGNTNKNADWFQMSANPNHLSQKGVAHLKSLWEKNISAAKAAKEMNITVGAAKRRYLRFAMEARRKVSQQMVQPEHPEHPAL